MAKNRTCYICRQRYAYCPNCERDKGKPFWYFTFCSERCRVLNDILSQNTSGHLSIADAQKELKKIEFKKEDILDEDVRNHIEKILNYKDKEVTKPTEIKK